MTREQAIAQLDSYMDPTLVSAAEMLDDLEPYIQARIDEATGCAHDDDRREALAWASRSFKDTYPEDADALGDVVLHLADRYHQYLKGTR